MTVLSRSWARSRALGPCLAALATAALYLTTSGQAEAQQRTFYVDRLQIGSAPNDGFAVWRPRPKERTVFFGQVALGYTLKPLRGTTVAYNERESYRTPTPLQNQLTTYFSAGMELMQRLTLGVTLPVVAYQNGDNPCGYTGVAATCQSTDINSTVASDTRLDARLVLYRDNARRFHFGVGGSVWIPSGDRISFTTDDQTTGALQIMSELDLGKLIISGNTGVHFRPARGLNRLRVGNEWTWAAGAFIPLRDGSIRLGGEIFGSTGIGGAGTSTESKSEQSTTFTARNTPLEWLGELRIALNKDQSGWAGFGAGTRMASGYGAPTLRVLASVGYAFSIEDTAPRSPRRRFVAEAEKEMPEVDTDKDGIPDDLDACPTIPEDHAEPDPNDGCPGPKDRDHDGILDADDKCPDQPEDKDGIEDEDGCPEDDYDADGVPDTQDACPREPGQPSPQPDKNGCPQFIRRVEGSTEIQILKRVEFQTGKATILPQSFPILDEVVSLLKANKDIKRVAVEGHTDNRGGHDMNMRLSQSRAESVVKYLTAHGVDGTRLEAHGYGPDKPIDTNNTEDGRQRNRRVQFMILDQSNK